jgi:hypothetical protein
MAAQMRLVPVPIKPQRRQEGIRELPFFSLNHRDTVHTQKSR